MTLPYVYHFQGFNKAQIGNFYIYPDYSPVISAATTHATSDAAAGYYERHQVEDDLDNVQVSLSDIERSRSELKNGYGTCAVSSSGTAPFPRPLRDTWFNNTCLQAKSADLFAFGACQPADPNDGHIPVLANNTYATGDNSYVLRCGNMSWSLIEAQAAGIEQGSQLIEMPNTQSIVTTARYMLGF